MRSCGHNSRQRATSARVGRSVPSPMRCANRNVNCYVAGLEDGQRVHPASTSILRKRSRAAVLSLKGHFTVC